MFDYIFKKEDFINHSCKAFENYQNDRFEESAIQARKAGEAIVKILLTKKASKKLPITISEKSGFKELIIGVKENCNVPKITINQLETLQLVGNKASHDAKLTFTDAQYANQALKLLSIYLFEEVFVEKIPPRVQKFLDDKNNNTLLINQILKIKNELKENRKNRSENKEKNEGVDQIPAVGNEIELLAKIRELEQKINQVEEKQQTESSIHILNKPKQIEEQAISEIVIQSKKSRIISVKNIFIICFTIIFACLIFYFSFYRNEEIHNAKSTKKIVDTRPHHNKLTVGILNFRIDKDNPLVKLNIEEELFGYIKTIARENNWKISFKRINRSSPLSNDSILQICKSENIQLAIYGDISENSKGDSCEVALKYTYAFKNMIEEFTGTYESLKLSINSMNLQSFKIGTALLMNFGFAIENYYSSEFEIAYGLTKNLYTESDILMTNIFEFNYSCLLALNKIEEAKQSTIAYLKAFPDSVSGYLNYVSLIGENLLNKSRIDSVLKIAEKVNDKSPRLWYLKAEYIRQYQNDPKLYRKYIEKALLLYPKYYDALIAYANIYLLTDGNLERCIFYSNNAIEIDPLRYEGYYLIGDALFWNRNYSESAIYYHKAIKTSNLHKTIFAKIYEKLALDFYNNYVGNNSLQYRDSAIYYYNMAIRSSEVRIDEFYTSIALIYLNDRDSLNAEKELLKAVKINPSFAIGWENLMVLNKGLKKYDRMKYFAEKLIKLEPQNAYGNLLMAVYYLKTGTKNLNLKKGLSCIKKSLRDKKYGIDAYEMMGYYYMYLDANDDSAIYWYKKVIDVKPNYIPALSEIGLAYVNNQAYEIAMPYIVKCLKLGPNNLNANIAMTACYLNKHTKQSLQLAYTYAKKVIEIDQRNAMGYFFLAQIFIEGGNLPEALGYYKTAVELNPKLRNAQFEKILGISK